MMANVSVIDYGVGNLLSVTRALSKCGANVKIIKDPNSIKYADRVVLPGVGAFGKCMEELKKREFQDPILSYIQSGKPLLGICVGMQILHEFGEEFGYHQGLNVISGKVSEIPQPSSNKQHKIPFIGWAKIEFSGVENSFLKDIKPGSFFYFVHSFMSNPNKKDHCLASYNYNGVKVTAIIGEDNVIGCQFHPEKSGQAGLDLLNTFLRL